MDSDSSSTVSVCSSNGTFDSSLEVSGVSEGSQPNDRSTLWPTVDSPTMLEVDFGSLYVDYGIPFFICFYKDTAENYMSRVGDFYDVPLNEMVRALNQQRTYIESCSLVVRFDCCREEDIAAFLPALRQLLSRCQEHSDAPTWLRCTLMMIDYSFAAKVVAVLAEFSSRLLELNIGSTLLLQERHRCNPNDEAACVADMLKIWLSECRMGLKCLRIFAFVEIGTELRNLLAACQSLKHISFARFSKIDCTAFHNIESLEFNGCGMAFTNEDLLFSKHLVKYFPNVEVVGFRGVCFDPVLTSLVRHLMQTGGRYQLYQIVSVKQFASLVKTVLKPVPGKEHQDCVEFVSERFGTRLVVYGSNLVYRTAHTFSC
ncbi:hypothetical protein Q1695_010381 [Nippostrongylus brasiliensis]|nr:hypothetical protein Q1695_010381 [Nippostrongylus brasiliensis]